MNTWYGRFLVPSISDGRVRTPHATHSPPTSAWPTSLARMTGRCCRMCGAGGLCGSTLLCRREGGVGGWAGQDACQCMPVDAATVVRALPAAWAGASVCARRTHQRALACMPHMHAAYPCPHALAPTGVHGRRAPAPRRRVPAAPRGTRTVLGQQEGPPAGGEPADPAPGACQAGHRESGVTGRQFLARNRRSQHLCCHQVPGKSAQTRAVLPPQAAPRSGWCSGWRQAALSPCCARCVASQCASALHGGDGGLLLLFRRSLRRCLWWLRALWRSFCC